MKLILVRHGKDDDRYRGGWSNHGLTSEGIEQAKRLACFLQVQQGEYRICRILSSDLPRAMMTATLISDALDIPVKPEPRLREINNGALSGMLNEDALAQYPGLFFSTLEMDEPYPNGESPAVFHQRIQRWFEQICTGNPDENVLAVTHGGVINVLYRLAKGMEWSNRNRPFPAVACSIHILDIPSMRFDVENSIEPLQK